MSGYTLEGERTEGWKLKFAGFAQTSGDYFKALGIPLLAGRTFTRNDRAGSPSVVVISQSMAQHSWPGQNAIGKRMHAGNPKRTNMPWATVIGVVGNTRIGARDADGNDQWYIADAQPQTLFGTDSTERRAQPEGGFIVLRATLAPREMMNMVRAAVAEVDPLMALDPVETMGDVLARTESPRRFMTALIGAFALGALGLAITGIYAVMSFSVSLRTQEIAIRMALGAQREGIARLIVGSGMRLALIGCALGVAGSVAIARVLRTLLFGVSGTDPWVYAGSVLLMLVVAALASVLPAARAAAEDPVEALRSV
jgi:putative ABC transport system permease protein